MSHLVGDGGVPISGQGLSVVPAAVRDVGTFAYELAEALQTALESAAKEVDGLVNSTWTGDLATEFADGWSDLRDGGDRIIIALSGMASKLGITADTYQSRDDVNASMVQESSLDLP